MSNINWEGLITELGENISAEGLQALKDNKEFLTQLAKDDLVLMMHYVVTGEADDLNGVVYSAMLSQLDDQAFLDLRKKSIESARVWANINSKKDKIIKDLSTKVGKMTANIIVKFVLLGI